MCVLARHVSSYFQIVGYTEVTPLPGLLPYFPSYARNRLQCTTATGSFKQTGTLSGRFVLRGTSREFQFQGINFLNADVSHDHGRSVVGWRAPRPRHGVGAPQLTQIRH